MTTSETTKRAIAENDIVQVNPKALAERGVGGADGMTMWKVTRVYKNQTANLELVEGGDTACTTTIVKIGETWLRPAETHEQREAHRTAEIQGALDYAKREIVAAIEKPTKERDALINELVAARDKGPGEVAYWMEWKSYHLAVASAKALLVARYYETPVAEWLANPTTEGFDALAAKMDEVEAEILKAEILQTISDGQSTSKSDSIATDAKLVAAKEILDGGSTSSMRWAIRGTKGWVASAKAAW